MKSKMWIVGFIVFLAVTALPSAAQETPAVTLPEVISDSWGSGGRTVGWEFSPTQDIVVTQLGLRMALGDDILANDHTVTLYDAAGTSLVSAVFSGALTYQTDGYAYTPVAGPTLTAGMTYVVTVWAASVSGDSQIGSVDGEAFDDVITPLRLNLYSDFSSGPVMPGNELSGRELLSASFKFEVVQSNPVTMIQDLIGLVASYNLQQGIDNSLDAKLEAAVKALEDVNANNDASAVNKLQAFINEAEAQRGNKLTIEQADELIAKAQVIIAMLTP